MDIKKTEPVNRLRGRMPKVGIRPVIDGRERGVRESLEVQTMNMARSAAKLIEENLRHSNGLPVECVIADSTIGGVAEAADCADKFAKEGVGVSLTVTPCWCYGTEVMDTDPLLPKAVWGFNGTERPGAVYLAAALAGYTQKGLPAFGIYGRDVQDSDDTSVPADVKDKLLRFTKSALAVATMKGKSYLSIGGMSMGIAGSLVNQDFLLDYLGMRTEVVDMSEVARRVEEGIFDKDEYAIALKWVKENCKEQEDTANPPEYRRSPEQRAADWEYVVKMVLIGKDLMVGNPRLKELGFGEESLGRNAICGGFQGQRSWTDHYPNGDFMETFLNTSFDWNGIREAFVMATENDYLNGITMLFGHLLTNTAQIFSDVRTFWSPEAIERVTGWKPDGLAKDGFIHLINSGSTTLDGAGQMSDSKGTPVMKPFWDITAEDVEKTLKATEFCVGDGGYFRGGGYSTDFLTKGGMPCTMARLNYVKGQGPVLQLAEGWTVDVPAEVHDKLDDRTNPTWPTTWFVPRVNGEGSFKDVYTVMAKWGANHGAVSYGHIGQDLITLCSMLRIPVNMHNVEEEGFRPSAWASFGMDEEGADFRACKNFGAIYG
ncbi:MULTISPECIES: L-fucose isomerase [unclassified Oceanispirochaeta]|uniref:L-fucose isomerase n=1 Tax=unclassified Oceanispirochaeta TaxID=2635722 RepID=UPI000E0995CD|nr:MULTISPECIES: L-fucose isomerase [unclassified Oceanispirochaeta]MBF9014459.1 L-fucose isomerase [Oceanispirochaeta sp. M2]NPD70715.1 L-fucose isomerase [Oceanispirochaeta sp. M1]RDG33999.1 L-fucose isomerase [Oceanispirochaeta sp. M1]